MGGSLLNILSVGGESLMNSRVGVDVTGHNIANAHTPGFSRQRLNVQAKDPSQVGQHIMGNGARIENIERVHDKYLESQLRKEGQSFGQKEALARGLSRIESLFNPELSATIRDRFNSFFNSIREMGNYPEEPAVRTHVAESAANLTNVIQSSYAGVTQIQEDINDEAKSEIAILNQKLAEVARLNQDIRESSAGSKTKANDLEDRRDKLVKEIGHMVDLQVYENDNQALAIRGPGGVLLVDGPHAAKFSMRKLDGDQQPSLFVSDFSGNSENNVTDKIRSGKLGGLFMTRDIYAQDIRNELNALAKGFGDHFNEIHRKGYGGGPFQEMSGRDFFDGLNENEPAANIEVTQLIRNEPMAMAAAFSPNSPGDNVVANELLKLAYEPVMDDGKTTVTGCYDRFVGRLGIESMRTQEDLNAAKIVMGQLESQRESTAGVSLDEEAANLLKYQHLFSASSRIITTADELIKTVLDLKR